MMVNSTFAWLTVSGKLTLNQWRLVFEFFDTPHTDRIMDDLVAEKGVDPNKPFFDQITEDEAELFLTRAYTSYTDMDSDSLSESLICLTQEELRFKPEKLNALRDAFDFDFFHEAYNQLDALYYINRKSCNPPVYSVVSRKEYEDQAHLVSSTQVVEALNKLENMDDVKNYINTLLSTNRATFNSLLRV